MNDNWIIGRSDLILITGANGYVGTKLVEILLEYGFTRLRCLARSDKNLSRLQQLGASSNAEVEIQQGNLLSRETCELAVKGATVIYHLAAGVEKSFPGCFLNSVVTTRNLLDAVTKEQTIKRFVNISSIAVYSDKGTPRGGVLNETCEVDTEWMERFEPYSFGKAKQDEIVLEYAAKQKLPYVIVRPSVVFGPGKVKITDRVGSNTFGVFLHLGLGNRVPLTYVDNCAEAIVLAGLRVGVEGEVFNIVDDDLPTSRQFLRQYKREVRRFLSIPVPYGIWYLFCYLWEKYSVWSGGQLPPVFNTKTCPVYWKEKVFSNSKAKEMLGWRPRVAMNDALKTFFDYMREAEGRSK